MRYCTVCSVTQFFPLRRILPKLKIRRIIIFLAATSDLNEIGFLVKKSFKGFFDDDNFFPILFALELLIQTKKGPRIPSL